VRGRCGIWRFWVKFTPAEQALVWGDAAAVEGVDLRAVVVGGRNGLDSPAGEFFGGRTIAPPSGFGTGGGLG
jgi:hypothetical protein